MSERYISAIDLLPDKFRCILKRTENKIMNEVTEIRIRSGKPICLTLNDRIVYPNKIGYSLIPDSQSIIFTSEEVTECFLYLCNNSVYSHEQEISQGFLSLKDGHRAGICGRAIKKANGESWISDISSINIRVAREIVGVAAKVYGQTFGFKGLLICGAPNSGKTTFLRDYIRLLSNCGEKVSVIDCRGEIAAVKGSICCLDVGVNTDVITGGRKSEGIEHALRVLSPNVIAFDEIGNLEELNQIRDCFNCGVKIITTFHCDSIDELISRSRFLPIINTNAFSHFVFLDKSRIPKVYLRSDLNNETIRYDNLDSSLYRSWNDIFSKA